MSQNNQQTQKSIPTEWKIHGDLCVEMRVTPRSSPPRSEPVFTIKLTTDEIAKLAAIKLQWNDRDAPAKIYPPFNLIEAGRDQGFGSREFNYDDWADVKEAWHLEVEDGKVVISAIFFRKKLHSEKEQVRIKRIYGSDNLLQKCIEAHQRLGKMWQEERDTLATIDEISGQTTRATARIVRSCPELKPQIRQTMSSVSDLLQLLADWPADAKIGNATTVLKALADSSEYYLQGLKKDLADQQHRATLAEQKAKKDRQRAEDLAANERRQAERDAKRNAVQAVAPAVPPQENAAEPNVADEAPKVNETTATTNETSGDATTGTEEQLAKAPENDSSAETNETKDSVETPTAPPANDNGEAKTAGAPEGNLEQPPAAPPTPPKAPRKQVMSRQERIKRDAEAGHISSGTVKPTKAEPTKVDEPAKKGLEALATITISAPPSGSNGVSKG